MRTDISSAITTAMASAHFSPTSKVYSQAHLPKWELVDYGETIPNNPFGFDAKVVDNYLYRARAGGTTWDDGYLYFQRVLADSDPATWDSWSQVSTVEAALPADKANMNPGQVAIGIWGSNVRIFYFAKTGHVDGTRVQNVHELYVIESSDDGQTWGVPTQIALVEESALQVVALDYNNVFFTDRVKVFDTLAYGYEGTAKYASVICIASYDGSWTVDGLNDWPLRGFYHLGRTARDPDDITLPTGDAATWGDPVWGGLGAALRPDNRVAVVSGGILASSVGHGQHSQGLYVFTYDPNDGDWWEEAGVNVSDYANDGYWWDVFARVSNVNGVLAAVWKCEDEPTDVRQTASYAVVPRRSEIVYSYSQDGILWTEAQAIAVGTETLGAGPMVLVGNTLYMIGWSQVMKADVTHIFKSDAPRTDITDVIASWGFSQTGRTPDTQMSLVVNDPINLGADPGDLITVEAGAVVDSVPTLAQVGQGYLDSADETLAIEPLQYGGQLSALMAKPLVDTRSRDDVDILPQEMIVIEPKDMLTELVAEWGDWNVRRADDAFWARAAALGGTFQDQAAFVECSTWDPVVHATGWWHQLAFLTYPATMNGQLTVKMRMGLEHKDQFGYSGTKNWPDGIYSTYVNGFGDRWGGDGLEADLDYCAGGIAFRGKDSMSTFVFAWEPALRSWNRAGQAGPEANGTCHPDTSIGWVTNAHEELEQYERNPIQGSAYGSESFGGYTIAKLYDGSWDSSKDNVLCLYMFVNDGEGEDRNLQNAAQKRYLLGVKHNHGMTPGNPVELHVVTYHGYIYCYYRELYPVEQDWSLAFVYNAGVHFGAGRFGLYGRGYNGPEGSTRIPLGMRNRTWFWDCRMVNNTKNTTIGEVARNFAWRAGVETLQDNVITEPPEPGSLCSVVAQNPVLDAEVTLSGEAGLVLRAVDVDNCVHLGIVPGNVGTGKLIFQTYVAGSPTKTLTVPTGFNIPTGTALSLRVSINENWYSLWIGNRLLGTVHYPYQGGSGISVYGSGWSGLTMPELYEQIQFATLDSNQSMVEAIDTLLGKRRVKRFITFDGKLRLSYFETHALAGTLDNTMVRSSLRRTDRRVTHCRVIGGAGWAEYKSTALPQRDRRFVEIDLPDIMLREIMWKEARAMVIESHELTLQANFAGYPSLVIEPEDEIEIIVDTQSVEGDFLVDDIQLSWQGGKLMQQIGTRQVYVE